MMKFREILEAYKWRPSKTQAREFASKMANDEDFRQEP